MAEMDAESVAQRAQAFIEENEDLVEDPETSEHVLAVVINQCAPIAAALISEYQAAASEQVTAADEYQEALDAGVRGDLSPREVGERERECRAVDARADEAGKSYERFAAFANFVQERYRAKTEENLGGGDEFAVPEEWLPEGRWASTSEDTPSNAYRPSLWRRWFGG